MEQVKYIDIVFENCEVAKVPVDAIYVVMRNIVEDIAICNGDGTFLITKTAKLTLITISKKKIKEIKTNFDYDLIERITKYNDITSIYFVPEEDNESELGVYVDWDYSNEFNNNYQSCEEDDDYIRISIGKDKEND